MKIQLLQNAPVAPLDLFGLALVVELKSLRTEESVVPVENIKDLLRTRFFLPVIRPYLNLLLGIHFDLCISNSPKILIDILIFRIEGEEALDEGLLALVEGLPQAALALGAVLEFLLSLGVGCVLVVLNLETVLSHVHRREFSCFFLRFRFLWHYRATVEDYLAGDFSLGLGGRS